MNHNLQQQLNIPEIQKYKYYSIENKKTLFIFCDSKIKLEDIRKINRLFFEDTDCIEPIFVLKSIGNRKKRWKKRRYHILLKGKKCIYFRITYHDTSSNRSFL